MHELSLWRPRLILAAGLCLLSLAPAGAAGTEDPSVRPQECPLSPASQEVRPADCPDWERALGVLPEGMLPGEEEEPPSPAPVEEEPSLARHIAGLLADQGLSPDQTAALCLRLEADPALLALLEGNELTGPDLIYLALPNGRSDRLDRYSAWADRYPELTPEEVVLQVGTGRDRVPYQGVETITDPDSLMVLVDKHHILPADYVPALEQLGAGYGSGSLRPEAAAAFRAMADAARTDGISLRSVSAYRSYQRQKNTYNSYLGQDSRALVDTYSARPGHSEHQTGLALDINVASTSAHFENTPAFAWLEEHCAEHGFLLRYGQGQEEITGYRFEPWHYRYVGVEAATACMEQGLTLEGYLALQRAY